MSRKLVSQIKHIKGLPGKHKRVLEAWAAFANNDGTNIFASKESVADEASVSKWTVFRNTDDLVAAGVLVGAPSHTCKTEPCEKGPWHYAGNGHYTRAYNISLAELQNATRLVEKLGSKMLLGQGSKMPKSKVAKSHATQALSTTPVSLAENDSPLVPLEEQVSKQAGRQAPAASRPTPGGEAQDQEQNQPEDRYWESGYWQTDVEPIYQELLGSLDKPFGLRYLTDDHIPDTRFISMVSAGHGGVPWALGCASWALSHKKFWASRVVDIKSFARALHNSTEKGLAAQYNRAMAERQ